jgi:predicted AlkP superfamily pyrophosphatase or phosphodiesterase
VSTTLVFLLLDAFRWDYLNPEDTPSLLDMASGGTYVRKLITSTGFTQRSAISCGAPADVSGNFTMFTFDMEGSPFRFLRENSKWQSLCRNDWWEIVPNLQGFRTVKGFLRRRSAAARVQLKGWAYQEAKKYAAHPDPAYVPLEILPLIGLSEDNRLIYEPGAFPIESIFDICRKQRTSFEYLMFPVTNCEDDAVLQTTLERISSRAQFYLLQFSDSDYLMHHHGTSGEMRRQVAGEIDRKLRVLLQAFERAFDSVTWVIVGDHGMTDIVKELDVAHLVHTAARKLELKHGEDYLLFLDSTMARLWHLTDKALPLTDSVFEDEPAFIDNGQVISEDLARKYRIPYKDRRYGDVIWWAKPGVLIFPDYFHDFNTHNKGMHGYDSYHEDMKGFAIVKGESIAATRYEEAFLVDICPTLCDLLGVSSPSANEGTSLIAGRA